MRKPRLKVSIDVPEGYYHCVSRVVDRRFIFREVEKQKFAALMRECEAFCRVQVLTYALMSNHFHVLVAVPRRPDTLPPAAEVLESLRQMTGHTSAGLLEVQLAQCRKSGDAAGERTFLEPYYARMWDVSHFMKLLKQRFTQWYNGRRARRGTLWEERFRSVVVEGAGLALGAMAAYIDLNPVRAGLVKDPKDYRWSGYGEAVAGRRRAKEGIARVVKGLLGQEESLSRSLEVYRAQVYRMGSEEREDLGADGKPVRGVLKREDVLKVLRRKGKLPLADYLKCRVRYFCDGAVFGGREFVEGLFKERRGWFGAKRKDGARRVRGLAGAELYTVRELRVKVFG
jgi:REP element-mobilizing transposase RayT